jgi:hypothetical protein
MDEHGNHSDDTECPPDGPCLHGEPQPTKADMSALYRERAHLLAYLAAAFPTAFLAYSDPNDPWPVLTVETIDGQMCWHINPADLDLFPHVRWAPDEAHWDGHGTAEKYDRLRAYTARCSGSAQRIAAARRAH